jgi:TatD DNase family protein
VDSDFSILVDFHCHLDLFSDHVSILEECEKMRIETLAVTNAPSVFPRNQMLSKNLRYVHTALGLHPQLAFERQKELKLFEEYLMHTRFVGEVGLDASAEYAQTLGIQRQIFQQVLNLCANAGGKVLSVHSRRTSQEVIEQIEKLLPSDKGRVILHWFTGTKTQAREAIQAGCFFSINRRMLESPRGRELVASLPPERILTESDGPFIRIGNHPTKPKDVMETVEMLAKLWETDTATTLKRLQDNLYILLS